MSVLGVKPPRRRIVFMLTPLVDVMFLLLIFFMLSSQTSPYALLDIMAGGAAGDSPAPALQQPAPAEGVGEMLVSIARGYARLNGTRVELADLRTAIESYRAAGYARAVVTTNRTATVQDVVTVLEALKAGAFSELDLVTQAPVP